MKRNQCPRLLFPLYYWR